MKNKKSIMTLSALFILIFHLWIYVTNLPLERYLRQICVIGVDLFFFVSAFSIAKKNIEYKKFIINRFLKVYLKFIVLVLIACLYFKWDIVKYFKVILGIELFTKGGGSFLWFIPSIMLVYLLLPLYKLVDHKHQKLTPIITIMVYIFVSIVISLYTNYDKLFILTNRIPIMLLGYYFAKYNIMEYLDEKKIRYWLITIFLLILGIILSYIVYTNHFSINWFKEIFYIIYIPLEIGVILLLDKLKTNKFSSIIGSITLELYGLQMIFGFKIANDILKYTNIKLLSNIITIIVLIILAIVMKKIFSIINKIKLLRED